MVLAGLAFALAGGCPGRQLFLAGEGDGDSAIFVLGMVSGAALRTTSPWRANQIPWLMTSLLWAAFPRPAYGPS